MGITIKNATVVGDDGTFMRLVTDSDTDFPIDIDGLSIYGKNTTGFDIKNVPFIYSGLRAAIPRCRYVRAREVNL